MKGGRRDGGEPGREYIIEFRQVGHAVKVSAVDPATLTEVSIFGPPGAGRAALERAAVRKLEYALRKKPGRTESDDSGQGGRFV
ncbi:MAG: hypothetical protein ACE5Q3_05470 [Alphaproteobacteria bacterium]